MIRTINTAEAIITTLPPLIVVIGAASTTNGNTFNPPQAGTFSGTQILADRRLTGLEVSNCYIQNVGTNRLYFSIGILGCDATVNYNGYLEAGQQLDCSSHKLSVWGYSTAGTTVSTLQFQRNDRIVTGNIFNGTIQG